MKYGYRTALWLILCSVPLLARAGAPELEYELLNRYPHPQAGFTQGLLVDRGCVYETSGLYGRSYIAYWCPGDTRPQRLKPLPGRYFAEGLALVDDHLVVLTWRAGRALRLETGQFHTRGQWRYEGEGWGLTFDGQHFLMSDGSATIQRRDREDFRPLDSFTVSDGGQPVARLNELEWINGKLLANVWLDARIAVINPDTGSVSGWLDLSALHPERGPEDVLNGIAWDARSRTVLVTGKRWPEVFRLRVPALEDVPRRLPGMTVNPR